ncbi:hypothetical protein G3O08_17565 [Cryomorpha ignava]|uniref:GPI inositol-deacylase PGAP1-like alpha/beta domain-containing protein n=1 Tax=Cryomorpha ignava TaxID=101383 RepID=A0A7K3WUU7_9FLAO|nr:hypothetical protein [Cryomorpha ignava]NEN25308.1 hypothetical protein [Cryomorpha ignava]
MKIQDSDKSFDFVNTKLFLAVLCCLTTFFAFGQTVPFPTDTVIDTSVPFSEKMDDVFGNLDLTGVTTNLLLDRAWPFAKPADFDGSVGADTVKSHKHWLKLYGTMVTAATVQPSPIPSINDWKAQRDSEEAAGKNPLVIIHADYHRIKRDSALIYSLFYEQNGELYDYPNQSTSPYEAQTLFAFSPYKTTIKDSLSMDFKTSPAFFKTNTGLNVSTVAFDFDDGQGWKTVGLNTTVKVSWSSFGKKHLKLRITYTNNEIYYAYSTLTLVQTPNYHPSGAKNYNESWSGFKHIDHPDPALSNYGIDLQIEYACGNDKIIKPFIYVEGFSPDEYFEAFENETYIDFYDKFDFYQDQNGSGYPLLDELEANGYDIVYVDFEQGTGNILENAQTLKKAIKWVNDQKAANGSTEPNVVAGYSMGGLVARLAVRQMELDNTYGPPDVSYFITVDTPHLGANIPYAVAIAVDDLYRNVDISDYEEGIQNAYNLLNSPAAKQMLIYAFDIAYLPPFNIPIRVPAQMRTDFISELQIGLPQSTTENIAIAKGNGVGNSQGFTGVAELISIDIMSDYSCTDELVDTYDLIDGHTFANTLINLTLGAVIDMAAFFGATAGIGLDINALPGGDESFKIYERYLQGELLWGLVEISIGQYKVKARGIPFDSAPGGSFPINAVSGTGASAQFFQDILSGNYLPCIEIHQTQFGFVPTVSALNIPGKFSTPFAQIDPATVVANNETEFDKVFILDPTLYPPNTAPTNEAHVDLSPSNVGPFEEFISPDYSSINQFTSISDYFYNLGANNNNGEITETTDRITTSLILSGDPSGYGVVGINCGGPIVDFSDNTYPNSNVPNFSVYLTKGCASSQYGSIEVEPYGSILIGETTANTGMLNVLENAEINLDGGAVEVRSGSKLVVHDGGEINLNSGLLRVRDGGKVIVLAGGELLLKGGLLKVDDGGEVIIKAGGKLIYEDGAQIELNGNNAVLALGGLTHIGDDATFTFTYQGTESGYIRMLKEGYWGERFSAGLNAKVELRGENKDDLILYMEENADFWEFQGAVVGETYSSQKLDWVKFKYGKIIMEEDARIVLINKSDFIQTTVESLHEGHHPRGVVPFTTCYISHSLFNRVPINAALQYFESGPLYITSSEFTESRIVVEGYGYIVQFSDFWFSPIISSAGTVGNKIHYSTFTYGSRVSDISVPDMFIYKSEFVNNSGGVGKSNGRLTLKCNTFENNETAVYGGKGSDINLSSLYSGGYNFFRQNDYNIKFNEAFDLLMEDGYNEFYDGNIMNVEAWI